jgi:phosphatidylglycerophosphatase A
VRDRWTVWIAQGCGVGRVPVAPGTFGTLPGLLWFVLLLLPGRFWLFLAGLLLGLAVSVWLCGAAEKVLHQTDPPSVVLDEITAVPICFLPWVIDLWLNHGTMPQPQVFFQAHTWWLTALLFALFRCFDILKPWPIRQSQRLPGGWGVTVDDVLAALCVAMVSMVLRLLLVSR